MAVIERQTYSFLEWLGDIGGLLDALRIIGAAIVGPVVAFSLKATLLNSVFRYVASLAKSESQLSNLDSQERLKKHLGWDLA